MFCLLAADLWGQTSVLATPGRTWHKFSVSADAVYKIDYALLKNIGFNPDGKDPSKFQLYATPLEGMLPQPNTPRNGDLVEVPIHMVDGGDGKFNAGDYFLFFGRGPDRWGINPSTGTAFYENHLYADKNFYFLTHGNTAGLRVAVQNDQGGSHPSVEEYDDVGFYENDQINLLRSGRYWYGERFGTTLEYTVRFEHTNVVAGSSMKLITGVMGASRAPALFEYFINGALVGDRSVPAVIDFPPGYGILGVDLRDTLTVNATSVSAPGRTNQDVRIKFTPAASTTSSGYLDYLVLQSRRRLALSGNQTIFRSLKSLEQPITRYGIHQATADGFVWDVTDFLQTIYRYTTAAGVSRFTANSNSLRTYVVVSHQTYPVPAFEEMVPTQNLRGMGATDLLIITAPDFLSEANRLAQHRRTAGGLNVSVVTTAQVYHEFSGGRQDVTALRDFIKFLYDQGTGLKNVLLFGRGSYDYKDKLSFNKNFVPTYQSRNSLDPLSTYASDDYYGFLESTEGNWGESPAEPHTLDIGVGRIPVKKVEEASAWVDKVIAYENQNWGPWRKRIVFTADDGDFNTHQSQADQLGSILAADHPEVDVQKVYLDAYTQAMGPSGPVSKPARQALNRAVNDGAGIINYTGHGSELQWMQERILDQISFDEWKPNNRYPFLVTATCEFGRNDDPGLISTAELALFRKNSGTIGLVTTSRPVYSSTNFTLNKAFYESLFTRQSGLIQDWGAVFRLTKNTSMAGVSNRNFTLLGDPSMYPPLGSSEVVIDEIANLTSGSDTVKAMSNVRVRGHVEYQGSQDNQHDGIAQLTFYDKLTSYTTKGDENAPFDYTLRDNALFRGQVQVQSGEFEMDFILPKAIDPVVGMGKISVYSASKSAGRDATGAAINIKTGDTEADPGTDGSGPGIELFMGDTTFIPGGWTGTSSRIVAILTDASGIDISSYDSDNDILALLDDTLTLHLNAYYQTDVGTYTRGKVDYPIEGLKAGHHTLTLQATDIYGNTSSATLTFYVIDSPGIQIEQWLNYPNPFSTSTTFHFKHNRPGEDLEAAVTIFDRMGKVVNYSTYQIGSSTYKVDLPPWDGTSPDGNKLAEGLYLMKLTLRSLLDGTKNERIAKFILLN